MKSRPAPARGLREAPVEVLQQRAEVVAHRELEVGPDVAPDERVEDLASFFLLRSAWPSGTFLPPDDAPRVPVVILYHVLQERAERETSLPCFRENGVASSYLRIRVGSPPPGGRRPEDGDQEVVEPPVGRAGRVEGEREGPDLHRDPGRREGRRLQLPGLLVDTSGGRGRMLILPTAAAVASDDNIKNERTNA